MNWANALRTEIAGHARAWAEAEGVESYESLGAVPAILLPHSAENSRHGNFGVEAWQAIQANPQWKRRLAKPHPVTSALPPEWREGARELDSCNSSDALLKNCFCPAGAVRRMARLIGCEADAEPEFGVAGKVPLTKGRTDATELDMRVGSVIVEAKLTELSFTTAREDAWRRYQDIDEHFALAALLNDDRSLAGYQLVRNVMAAENTGARLIVLLDWRRPDLLHEWWRVHGAIRDSDLRARCGWRAWQEIAAASSSTVRDVLHRKYGLPV